MLKCVIYYFGLILKLAAIRHNGDDAHDEDGYDGAARYVV